MAKPLLIVADYNGTVVDYEDEAPLWKKLGLELAADAKSHIRLLRLFGLLKAKSKLEELHKSDAFADKMGRMYEIYNQHVLKGVPISFVHDVVDRFGREYMSHVDYRLVLPIWHAKLKGPARTAILSTAYDESIRSVLGHSGFKYVFERIEANPMAVDKKGRVSEFKLEKHRNKADYLRPLQERFGSSPDRTVYWGDNEIDDGCLRNVKYPAVSFHAKDSYKEKASREFGAFVPDNEADARQWLMDKTKVF